MGKQIQVEFRCEVCRAPVMATGGNQRTCLSKPCKLKLRSKNRKIKRRADRKRNPIQCIWCDKPITQIGKREYHPKCRADKNRERVRLYNATHKSRIGPKKPKQFKSTVKCAVCGKREKRTGGRQVVCSNDACRRARREQRKKALRDAPKAIEEMRKRKIEEFRDSKGPREGSQADRLDDARNHLLHHVVVSPQEVFGATVVAL